MTRPVARNGFGLSVPEAEREVRLIEAGMTLLPDGEAVYREWWRIIVQHGVLGVQVHDARLAASMYVHGVSHILTLNVVDFSRFSGLTAIHPKKPPRAQLQQILFARRPFFSFLGRLGNRRNLRVSLSPAPRQEEDCSSSSDFPVVGTTRLETRLKYHETVYFAHRIRSVLSVWRFSLPLLPVTLICCGWKGPEPENLLTQIQCESFLLLDRPNALTP